MKAPRVLRLLFVVLLIVGLVAVAAAQGTRRSNGNSAGPLASSATAKSAPSLGSAPTAPVMPRAADVLAEINAVRANPAKYAAYLEQMRANFKGNTLKRPGRLDLTTNEGMGAVDEAIRFLKAAKPLPALRLSPGMSRAAGDQAGDMVKNNISGHKGSDGSLPEDRCARYGKLLGNEGVGENIAYEGLSAREVVEGFLVDDGTANRGHRRNVFSTSFKIVGIGIGNPAKAEPLYVVTFADGYSEKGAAPPKGKAAARQM